MPILLTSAPKTDLRKLPDRLGVTIVCRISHEPGRPTPGETSGETPDGTSDETPGGRGWIQAERSSGSPLFSFDLAEHYAGLFTRSGLLGHGPWCAVLGNRRVTLEPAEDWASALLSKADK